MCDHATTLLKKIYMELKVDLKLQNRMLAGKKKRVRIETNLVLYSQILGLFGF